MMVFKHVSRINVSLWGQRVGTLVAAPQRDVYAFRYEKGFLRSGIEISPLMMPLRAVCFSRSAAGGLRGPSADFRRFASGHIRNGTDRPLVEGTRA